MTRIKICGITDIEPASLCSQLGADFIGLVFAKSRRRVTEDQAKEITEYLLSQRRRPEIVGVFVNTPASEVNQIADSCHLDRVQLSGDEDEDYCRNIKTPIIKATRIVQGFKIPEIKTLTVADTIHLFDSGAHGLFGGSGKLFDWAALEGLDLSNQVIVAGGLTPENVEELVLRYHPWGVDVSSGVETNHRKDPKKIRDFISAVRKTDAKLKGAENVTR
ncbi:phosphoribosylanthranilate isomerase [Dehalogenimonas etheniformans]|uniref:N-(5'-phosphoribosyl)anthranilate isomerase n=1 Tax=Dehalogenimonas etheniformans TaxID=1536648 RepID=A0A2P5P824_9CHLR|nr:phosphoribosylanthranilate isomerase [Dehalogenimonas etheniformans]PPD58452.1 phosphoribosylanthranilate isomerase [Dehalogenimonas etheniformans]QNT75864.1 phosphoribosylanthranilate isomerase [Dehalogenimonas etheniformans]